jgi:hypothetical protein
MEARIIIPTARGEQLCHELRLHHSGPRSELRIVFETSEETFERWLFYLLRDVGAHIVADETALVREALNLQANEPGVLAAGDIAEFDVTRHVVKTTG